MGKIKGIIGSKNKTLIFLFSLFIFASQCSKDKKAERGGLFPISVAGKWGYIDTTGKIVIKPQFDDAGDFSEGLARVAIIDTNGYKNWGYIDKTGNFVIKPQFEFAEDFSEGLARVGIIDTNCDEKWGYIDKTGKYVWGPTK